jgi:hypothetical protein
MWGKYRIYRALSLYEYGWKTEALDIMTQVIKEEVDSPSERSEGYVEEEETQVAQKRFEKDEGYDRYYNQY